MRDDFTKKTIEKMAARSGYLRRQWGPDEETHPFVDEIIAAINDLIQTGAREPRHPNIASGVPWPQVDAEKEHE